MTRAKSTRYAPLVAVLICVLLVLTPQMALADVAYESVATTILTTAGQSITISRPTGTAQGDLLLAAIAINENVTNFAAPSGWTQVNYGNSGNEVVLAVYYKVAGASEPTSYAFTWTNSYLAVGTILRYSGVDTTNPIDVSGSSTGTSNSAVAPSVTTTVDGAMVVRIAGVDTTALSGTPATQRVLIETAGTGSVGLGVSDAVQATAGATGTAAFALSASEEWRAVTVALRPLTGVITGLVFRDYDADGARDSLEPGVAGVTVTAYDTAGTAVATTTTNSAGAYTLTGLSDGTQYRLEVTGLPGYLQPGPAGTNCRTTVNFATSPATGVGVGVANPGEYCQNNPYLVTNRYFEAAQNASANAVLIRFSSTAGCPDLDANGTCDSGNIDLPAFSTVAQGQQVGTTWGLAYDPGSDILFAASFMKRHTGFRVNGATGVIYAISDPDGTPAVSVYMDLSSVTGADPHPADSASTATWENDANSWDWVGKMGLGDIDISDDHSTLWTINLATRELYAIPVSSPPPAFSAISAYVLPQPTGTGVCPSANDIRPFATKFHDGRLYVGMVCTAESTNARADMRAFVYSMDPASPGTFTQVLNFALNYNRRYVIYNSGGTSADADWNPWRTSWTFLNPPGPIYTRNEIAYPQPWLTDIEFQNGDMILGIRDRFGDQTGYQQRAPTGTTLYTGDSAGDTLRACGSPSAGWTLESNGACGGTTTGGAGNNQGPGGGEFYYQEYFPTYHDELSHGGLIHLPGTDRIVETGYDPIYNATEAFDGGIFSFNSLGQRVNAYRVYSTDSEGTPVTFGKAGGLGDLEALCSAAPLEIGNRVWLDSDGDGIQDPGESPIPNVTIRLYNAAGTLVATTTTGSDGTWYFGTTSGLAANTQYFVVVDPAEFQSGGDLYGYSPTVLNGGTVLRDSDATGVTPIGLGGQVGMVYTTGAGGHNDHTLDMGFRGKVSLGNLIWEDQNNDGLYNGPVRVGDFVWYDLDGDGIQDTGEPGVAGVSVALYDNSTNRLLATTTTGADGLYLFDNLPAGNYYVIFDLGTIPPGFSVTTRNAGGDDALDSDADQTTGQTAATGALSAGQQNVTLDMGLVATGVVAVGDRAWYDLDRDGIQDAGEPGVPGVRVELHPSSASDCSGRPLAATTTGDDGLYLFAGLAPASYRVCFDLRSLPAGYEVTTQNAGDDAVDSDADAATGLTAATPSLTAGQADRTLDMGIRSTNDTTNSIGDKVWVDRNRDGDQDGGAEPGVPGVRVELHPQGASCSDMPLMVDVTDEFGSYLFDGLPDGSYFVCFDLGTLPSGYEVVPADQGGDDAQDSDANPTTGATPPVSVSGGASNLTLDMGIRLTSTSVVAVGDRVWLDADRDGIQDAGELGVPSVRVELHPSTAANCDGTPLDVDVTDGSGYYLFDNLPTGNYFVCFDRNTIPTGFEVTTQNQGSDDTADSDADTTTGQTASTGALSGGQSDLTLDMGIRSTNTSPVSVGDRVWFDGDRDGVQDTGEPGVPGVRVTLYAAGSTRPLASTTTDSSGAYLFAGLAPGSYYVIFDLTTLPAGYAVTTADQGGDDALDSDANTTTGQTPATGAIPAGGSNLTLDMGIILAGDVRVGDRVWYDDDRDGRQDPGETGVAGVTVYLHSTARSATCAGSPLGSAATGADGRYLFANLAPGNYFVCFDLDTLPAGYQLSPANTQADDNLDSDADATGKTAPTGSLAAGRYDLSLDMGIYSTGSVSVGDRVWYDRNRDGLQDAGEAGVYGVVVELYRDGQTCGRDWPLGVTATGANGWYLFDNLAPGSYFACFDLGTLPAGYEVTTQNAGGDDARDSDADPATGATASTGALSAGQSNLTLDMGIRQADTGTVAVGDRVWYDDDRDGIQDAGEIGVPGIDVALHQASDAGCSATPLATTTTAGDGLYLFSGLPAGTYFVCFDRTDIPTGYTVTDPNEGGDDGLDSDADPTTGRTPNTGSLAAGEVDRSLDMGIIAPLHERPLAGVTVYLFAGSAACAPDGTGAIAVTITDEDGKYLFTGLVPGDYYIYIPPSDFGIGGALEGMGSSSGNDPAPDPDDDVNNDDNGTAVSSGACSGGVSSAVVTLGVAQEPANDENDDPNTPDVSHNMTVDLGFWAYPTAVDLEYFTATADGSGVLLEWKTVNEISIIGFNLYRSDSPDGAWIQINGALIPAQVPGSPTGAVYQFSDQTVEQNRYYYYWLQVVDTSGQTGLNGPASVLVGGTRVYLPLVIR